MYRDARYKLVIYHNKGAGELYDLKEDPWEFDNLWDDPLSQDLKNEMIYKSFNDHVVNTTDMGAERIAPM